MVNKKWENGYISAPEPKLKKTKGHFIFFDFWSLRKQFKFELWPLSEFAGFPFDVAFWKKTTLKEALPIGSQSSSFYFWNQGEQGNGKNRVLIENQLFIFLPLPLLHTMSLCGLQPAFPANQHYLPSPKKGLIDPDMKKHPSSLAALAEIFWDFGGHIFKWLPLFCNAFGGKQKKLYIILQIPLLFNQKHY